MWQNSNFAVFLDVKNVINVKLRTVLLLLCDLSLMFTQACHFQFYCILRSPQYQGIEIYIFCYTCLNVVKSKCCVIAIKYNTLSFFLSFSLFFFFVNTLANIWGKQYYPRLDINIYVRFSSSTVNARSVNFWYKFLWPWP